MLGIGVPPTVRSLPIIIILLLFYFVFWGPIAGSMGAPLRIRRLNFNMGSPFSPSDPL